MSEPTPREKVRAILIDRWSLDEYDGWDEFGEETLDEIDAAYGASAPVGAPGETAGRGEQ